ncbi:MAG: DUF3078 domain-containing protein [Prevotella sp.]|nr:DUF3078 domain-containing protein [Prevotella sp.]MCR5152429.1 DUF3078 domain-containing protein [Prevotella sp.]
MKRLLFAAILLFAVLDVSAQSWLWRSMKRNNYRITPVVTKKSLAEQYGDSLTILMAKCDSIYKASKEGDGGLVTSNPSVPRLFMPMTFYHSEAHNYLSLDTIADPLERMINKALLAAYISHPDLVVNSERRLDEKGKNNEAINMPISTDLSLTDKIKPDITETKDTVVTIVVEKPNFWTIKGDYNLQLLQNYVSSNWHKGGESNYSMMGSVVMEANYNNKQKVKWDNKLELKLGFQTSKSDSLHSIKTTEDLIRYTGKLGLQASKKWYYTLQVLTHTQFARGYKSNDPKIYSEFGTPYVLNISLGMDYNVEWFKKRLTGTIHLAPVAYNYKYVKRMELATRNGIDEGKHSKHDYGSQFTIDLTWAFSDNIKWKTRMYGFTSYKRVEYEWENTFSFKFNKFISANLFVYPRFDDSAKRVDDHSYWQLNEFMSLGFSYSF